MFIDSHLLCCEKPTRDYVIFWTNIISSTSIDENFIYFDKLVLQSKRFTTPGCPAANQPATAGTSPAAPAHTAQPASTGSPVTQAASQQISQAITSQGLTKMWIEKTRTKLIRNIIPRAITRKRNTLFAVSRCHTFTPSDWANALFIRNWRFFSSNSSCVIPTGKPVRVSIPSFLSCCSNFWFASWVSQATSHIPLFPQLHVLCQRGYHLAGHPCQPLVVFLESHLVASIFTRSIIITRKHNLIRLMRNVRSMENPRNLSCSRNQQNHVRYKKHEKH